MSVLRRTAPFATFCGQLRVGWRFCEPADPQAKSIVERLQGYLETNFEPGRELRQPARLQDQLDRWFDWRANCPLHRRPVDLLSVEREVMRLLLERAPDTEKRWVLRVPPDAHVRLDTNDDSLDPALVGRRVEIRVEQRVTGVALDASELASRRPALFHPPSHDHRARARPRPEGGPSAGAPSLRSRPRRSPLRPPDPGMTETNTDSPTCSER